jgi:hypothetical protein
MNWNLSEIKKILTKHLQKCWNLETILRENKIEVSAKWVQKNTRGQEEAALALADSSRWQSYL